MTGVQTCALPIYDTSFNTLTPLLCSYCRGKIKRNEILQLALLDSELAILDETDSGLDIDALRIIGNGINSLMSENKSIILITHYQRLLDYIKPDFVHVMVEGKIIKTGDYKLVQELEVKGYNWLK